MIKHKQKTFASPSKSHARKEKRRKENKGYFKAFCVTRKRKIFMINTRQNEIPQYLHLREKFIFVFGKTVS